MYAELRCALTAVRFTSAGKRRFWVVVTSR
jgi:hypothetical protein